MLLCLLVEKTAVLRGKADKAMLVIWHSHRNNTADGHVGYY